MTFIILSWVALTVCEAYRHYYLIEHRLLSPNRILSAVLRTTGALAVWILWPFVFRGVHMEVDQWWAIPIMEVFVFWFLFDLLLNIMRGKYFFYLGNSKWIDRIQKNTFGEFPMFFFKFLMAVSSITLCYTGLRAVVDGYAY